MPASSPAPSWLNSNHCPCASNQPYSACCQPLHQGAAHAKTAEQLMRSRFSAFAKQCWPYLVATGPECSNRNQEMVAIKDWGADKTWLSLVIIESNQGHEHDHHGTVEFVAFFREHGCGLLKQHHEQSHFARDDSGWRFIGGEALADITIQRNQRCPCGSGKKYKQCCQD